MFALLSLASRYVSDRSLVLLGTAVLLFSLLWHAVTIPSFEKGLVIGIRAGIFKQSMGSRNRVGSVLSHGPARLHSLAELVPWNRFLGSLKVKKFGLWTC
jgi:hypothetical protein